jgi:hypothetical protein
VRPGETGHHLAVVFVEVGWGVAGVGGHGSGLCGCGFSETEGGEVAGAEVEGQPDLVRVFQFQAHPGHAGLVIGVEIAGYLAVFNLDPRTPEIAGAMKADPGTRLVVSVYAAGHHPEIAAAIIETVAINVVHLQSSWWIHQNSVKQRARGSCNLGIASGMPAKTKSLDKRQVRVVNLGRATVGKRERDHDSGLHFGQPERPQVLRAQVMVDRVGAFALVAADRRHQQAGQGGEFANAEAALEASAAWMREFAIWHFASTLSQEKSSRIGWTVFQIGSGLAKC